jgi:hypothetical protein
VRVRTDRGAVLVALRAMSPAAVGKGDEGRRAVSTPARDEVVDAINAARYLIRKDGTEIARVTDAGLREAIVEVNKRQAGFAELLTLAAELAAEVTIFWSPRACAVADRINAIDRAAKGITNESAPVSAGAESEATS